VRREESPIRERRTPARPFRASAIDRHQLDLFSESSWTRKVNSMVLPGVSVETDIADINNGQAWWLGNNRWEINSRVYVHKGDGTVYPESGDLVIAPTKYELQILQHLIAVSGDEIEFERRTGRNPEFHRNPNTIANGKLLYELWKAAKEQAQ
jgi:hypothetical protein